MIRRMIAVAALAAAAGCAAPAPGDPATSRAAPADGTPPPAAEGADTGTIARLERKARALAHTEGCTAGACRTAPLGVKACGGPRDYIVYCAATTDSAALFAKLAQLARAERAYNDANHVVSTCEYRMPPSTRIEGGRCVAAPSNAPIPR